MKKIVFATLVGAACSLGLTSCEDQLDIPQKGVVAYDTFYNNTDKNAQEAMTNAYETFALNIAGNSGIYVPYTMLFNICADDLLAAGEYYGDNDQFASINEFRYDSQNEVISTMYNRFYYAIYGCNLVIDNFTPDTPEKKRIVGEARVLRAWCHMMAAIAWDRPPLVDHLLDADAKPSNYEGTHEELLKWCANECAEVVGDLAERKSADDKDGTIVVTKGLAWTVQGKALLFAGDLEGAKAALKNVINSGKYALVPGDKLRDQFHVEGDGSSEKIFEINRINNTKIGDWDNNIQRSPWMQDNLWSWRSSRLAGSPTSMGDQGWGGLAVEENFAKELYENEPNSYRRKVTMLTFDEFITDLPYASDTIKMDNNQKMADPGRGVKNTMGLYGQPGFLHNKRIVSPEDREGRWFAFYNHPIFRYAEVLLMYAECAARTSDSDGLGAKCLKDIQTRAGAPVTAFNETNVMREKRFEMWCEGVRWPDMVRRNEFDGPRMKNPGNHIPSTVDLYFVEGDANYHKKHVAKITYSNPNADAKPAKVTTFVASKHKYFPYPYTVVAKNSNIKQNNGWGETKSEDNAK